MKWKWKVTINLFQGECSEEETQERQECKKGTSRGTVTREEGREGDESKKEGRGGNHKQKRIEDRKVCDGNIGVGEGNDRTPQRRQTPTQFSKATTQHRPDY